ncbi:biotin/lipoyl-binding protein, partial [Klebsiella pneumoniae]|uniref:biotin/lipoyl-binding protein n=1 Tax=Klebsiella pneumoniae TaxID=573 RepID=UPI0027320A2D
VEQDLPRYLSGIGSVLSLHSVVIRPQIDGVLTKLLVKEGQLVKAGDLLATIDDRSIRASLGIFAHRRLDLDDWPVMH